jgi:hypothetical protein
VAEDELGVQPDALQGEAGVAAAGLAAERRAGRLWGMIAVCCP